MALPSLNITKINGSARPLQAGASKALIIGPALGGSSTVLETTIYTVSNPNSVAGTTGYGPVQECAELVLAEAPSGFSNVDIIVASGSIAASITTVSAASPAIDVTNVASARQGLDLRVTVTKAGGRGVGKFTYSLDGSQTTTSDILIPSNGQFTFTNTGVSCSFADSSHAVGNASHHAVKGPRMTITDLASCINTVSNSNVNYTSIIIADDNDDPVSGSALFTAMNTHLTTLASAQFKFTQAVVGIGGETKLFNRSFASTNGVNQTATAKSNMTSKAVTAGNGIMAVAEKVNTQLAIPYAGMGKPRRSFAYLVGAAAHAVGNDISRNIAATFLPRASFPSYDEFRDGTTYHDDRIVAPRSFPGEAGIFVNQSLNKYTTGGETFDLWYKNRLANRASEVVRTALRPYLNNNIRVLTDGTGRPDPRDLIPIESAVIKALTAAIIQPINLQGTEGYCSGFDFSISRENNVLSTSTLECQTRIVPFANISAINVTISLEDSLEVIPTA